MRAAVRTVAGIAALAIAGFGSLTVTGAANAAVSTTAPVIINEVYGGGGNSGAPLNQDFVELFNTTDAPIDLAGHSLQYASAAGTGWQRHDLTGTIPANGYFLVGEAFGANTALPAITADASGTLALSGTGGKVALALTGANLTCGLTCATDAAVVDLVGWGASTTGGAGTPAPATTNATSVSRAATHANTTVNSADFTAGAPTPQNSGTTPEEPEEPGDPDTVTIAEIQGTGAASPLAGQTVTTSGVVTAAYPTGGFAGYVIQTPGADTTPDASDALFVFSSATVAEVAIGDHVEVTGAVSEFNGLTEITVPAGGLTQLDEPAAATALATAIPTTEAGREALESMLITPLGEFTVTNTFSTNQYGEVGLATGSTPLIQPTDAAAPGSAEAAAVAADNAARAITLDDGQSTNFLSAANQGLTPPYVSLTTPVRVGAAATLNGSFVLDYRNSAWKLNPTSPYTAGVGAAPALFENDRTEAPAEVGGDISVASFNVLNYFTTLGADTPGCTSYNDRAGDPVTVNSGCDPRGAWDPADLTRQQDKIVAAINDLDADVIGLLEIENSAKVDGDADEALGTLVDALNAAAGSEVWAFVPSSDELPPAADLDVITNALIYRVAAVEPVGDSRALGTESDEPVGAFQNAREPIAQTFEPVGGGDPILVAVNHFKSKGSAGPWPGDADAGDGQGTSNESRVRQATALRDWIEDIQGDTDAVALVGDFNSYTREDPLQVLYDAGYTDAAAALAPGQYSYSFSGLSGSLDHVLLNAPALARATGADIWEINAEESIALEYSRYNSHGTLFYAPDEYRSSDHDPVIVGLTADAPDDGTGPIDLTLLGINDFHGRIDTNTVKLGGTIEQLRAAAATAGSPSALIGAGDLVGASLFASAVQDDQPTIDVLNAMGLDASAVGNHEFDQGYADLMDRIIADGGNAMWDYLGANVYLKGTDDPALPEYVIIDMDGVKVGVTGAVTEETPTLVSPAGVAELDFGDPIDAVNRVAAQLTDGDEGNGEADVVVATFHEGAPAGESTGATLESETAKSPVFNRIVNEVSADVDAIFNGHTHQAYAWDGPIPGEAGATRPVLQTGQYGDNIGEIVLTYDRDTDEVTGYTKRNVPRTTVDDAALVATYPRLANVKTIVDAALAEAAVIGNQPVGSVTADITTAFTGGSYVGGVYTGAGPTPTTGRDDRAKESTLGNLVADSLLDTLDDADRGGAEIGVVNPGGLRAELLQAPDGVITYAEANAVLPFVNNLWTTTLTGAQVKEMLEQQWQTDAEGNVPSRPYLQLGLSNNVSYTFDVAATQGNHITSITVDGAPIDPTADYRIGTFSFLTAGGDNFRVLAEGADARDSGLVDREAWIAYLQANAGLTPDFGRQAVGVPALPESVDAGDELAFPVSGLDLTSLGAPLNTTLDVALDGTSIGSATVTGGAADVAVTIPAGTTPGTHTLTLTAAPSGTVVTLSIEVAAGIPSSTTTLTASKTSQPYNPALTSQRILLTATVESEADVTGKPVQFVANGQVLGTATLNASGVATLRAPATAPVGTYSVLARFAGDAGVQGSESAPLQLSVAKAASTTKLSVSSGFIKVMTANVTLDNGRLASGVVQFKQDGRVVATSRVVLGVAIGVNLSLRTANYTATFVPDSPATTAGSTSSTVRR